MNDYVQSILVRRGSRALLIDSNLFVLFVVGSYSRRAIETFKRTNKYSEGDFDALTAIIDMFLPHARALTTPHVLAEASNLIGQASGSVRTGLFRAFARVLPAFPEASVPATTIAEREEFPRFGLTDCGILEVQSRGVIVLTDDLPLAIKLESTGGQVINFNQVRIERSGRS